MSQFLLHCILNSLNDIDWHEAGESIPVLTPETPSAAGRCARVTCPKARLPPGRCVKSTGIVHLGSARVVQVVISIEASGFYRSTPITTYLCAAFGQVPQPLRSKVEIRDSDLGLGQDLEVPSRRSDSLLSATDQRFPDRDGNTSHQHGYKRT